MNIYVGVLFYRVFSIRCFKIIQYTCPFIIVKTKECWLNYEGQSCFPMLRNNAISWKQGYTQKLGNTLCAV